MDTYTFAEAYEEVKHLLDSIIECYIRDEPTAERENELSEMLAEMGWTKSDFDAELTERSAPNI